MIAVLASFRLPEAALAEARALIPAVLAATRAEDGCIAYDMGEDVSVPGLFQVSELWASEAALRAHLAAPHMAEWGRRRADMGMTDRELKVLSVSGELSL